MKDYGLELILDIHNCNINNFNRDGLKKYFDDLCVLIDMQQEDLHFWDYNDDYEAYKNAPPHLKGTSAIQFIKTSNIVIHTLDELKKIFINIFTCKDFDIEKAQQFSEKYFGGKIAHYEIVRRI